MRILIPILTSPWKSFCKNGAAHKTRFVIRGDWGCTPGAFRPGLAENDPLDRFPSAAAVNKRFAMWAPKRIACYYQKLRFRILSPGCFSKFTLPTNLQTTKSNIR
jgi:hypothetical protein